MKLIDRHVILFAVILAICTVAFRYFLSTSIEHQQYSAIWRFTSVYALVIFLSGWYYGKAHSLGNFRYDIGIPFHTATYITVCIVSELWFLLGFAHTSESIISIHAMVGIWGAFLAIHLAVYFILKKRTINGISKSEIFD